METLIFHFFSFALLGVGCCQLAQTTSETHERGALVLETQEYHEGMMSTRNY